MKKFAKMSLVAAVAVAGLTSTVSASDLAEAIKNTTVSGNVAIRYNDRSADTLGSTESTQTLKNHETKVNMNFKSKVNDDITALVGGFYRSADNKEATMGSPLVNKVAFIYTGIENANIIVGKQGLNTPFTDGADYIGTAQIANGVTGSYTYGPATFIAAYYTNNSVNSEEAGQSDDSADIADNDIVALAAMANVGPVKLDAWFMNLQDAATTKGNSDANGDGTTGAYVSLPDGADFIKLGASGKVGPVSLSATYASMDSDTEGADKQSTWNLKAAAAVGAISGTLAYAQNDDKGGAVALEHDAELNFQGWGIDINNADEVQMDAEALIGTVSYKVNSAISLKVLLGNADWKSAAEDKTEVDEYYGMVTHTLSKNFRYYIRLGKVNTETKDSTGDLTTDTEETRGRLDMNYTF